jgi:hypothetical protein
MPKFKVHVTIIARTEYTVEVEANSESEAQGLACTRAIAIPNTPDFDVDLDNCEYETEVVETITLACEECGRELPAAELIHCPACNEMFAQEDAQFLVEHPEYKTRWPYRKDVPNA